MKTTLPNHWLQGTAFQKFQDMILNMDEINLRKCMDNNKADEQLVNKLMHHRSVLTTNDVNKIELDHGQWEEGQTDEWTTV
jgi:hypothetical protein